MPELPEVETICRGLAPILEGQLFTRVAHGDKNLRLPLPANLSQAITNKRITEVRRRAKYIQLCLEDGTLVIIHLGMSGKLIAHEAPQATRMKHDHVWMQLGNGKELVFNDPRRFGLVTVADAQTLQQHKLFVNLGIEPLSPEFTGKWLVTQCGNKKTSIKHLIMDASVVVGVGNIYASESLFRAGILPERTAGSLSTAEAEKLVKAVKAVLEAAIASGGSTLRDYVGADGNAGYFQHHFSVYGKEGKTCERCGGDIKRIVQSGRSSFYCMGCQI